MFNTLEQLTTDDSPNQPNCCDAPDLLTVPELRDSRSRKSDTSEQKIHHQCRNCRTLH